MKTNDQGGNGDQSGGGQGSGDQGGSEDLTSFQPGTTGGDDQQQQQQQQQNDGGEAKHVFTTAKGEQIEVPAALWDATANDGKGGINVEAALKEGQALREQLGVEVPKELVINVPETLAGKFEAQADNPVAVKLGEVLAAGGRLTQEAINELVAAYAQEKVDSEAKILAEDAEALKREADTLRTELGANAAQRVRELDAFLGATFGADEAMIGEIKFLRASAAGTKFLMMVRDKISAQGGLTPPGGGGGDAMLTEEQLKELQASPAYLAKDPATLKRVEEGWKRLYPPSAS